MAAEVVIESAGDHVFDLGHLRREGGEDLVCLLLREAGYDDRCWRLRVEKKITCGAETRPVATVGCKPWCCYLKIKPGDNNSGHYCSLLMPDGLRGEAVYEALKGAEERIGRNWRNGLKVRPAAAEADRPAPETLPPEEEALPSDRSEPGFLAPGPEPAAEPVTASAGPAELAEVPADGAARTTLRNWSKDTDKLRLTLLAIHEVEQAGPWPSQAQFAQALVEKLGWQDFNRHEIGGVFTSLVRGGHITGIRQGSKALGYTLTDRGRQFIGDLLTAGADKAEPVAPAPAADPAQLMLAFTGFAQRFADASQRLQANRTRRAELAAEIATLDAEARELGQLLGNPEVQALIQRLLRAAEEPAEGLPVTAPPARA